MPTTNSNNTNRSSQASSSSSSPTGGGGGTSWMTRIANVMRPNFGRNTPGRGGSSRITKLIFGTLLFVLVGQLLVTGLTVLDSVYKLGLQAPVFSGAPWLSWFFLIYFVLLIGLWVLLNYLGFFPKPEPLPPAGSRNRSSSSGAGGANKNATQIPGIGGPRARPVRAAAPPPPPPSPARRGIAGLGAILGLGASKEPAATAVATKSTKTATSQATSANRTYDEAYERAKAARRQKRRRSGR